MIVGSTGRCIVFLLTLALFVAACGPGTDDAGAVIVAAASPTPLATTAPLAASSSPEDAPSVDAPTAPTPPPRPQPTAPPATPTATPLPAAATEPSPVPSESVALEPSPVPSESVAVEPSAAPSETAAPEPTAAGPPQAGPEPDVEPTTAEDSTPAPAPLQRTVTNVGHVTLGQAGEVLLVMPIARLELLGFHEAGHPGSQAINAAGTGIPSTILESRGRGTASTSAADIVVPPGEPVRAPATGTVISANTYVLYCEHTDKLVYIEPDGLPGWQVRVFHVQGELPAVGTRVIAGQSLIADGARLLPFESQVDEFTAEPSWPHVHVEVVDTSIPDTRPPGPGCP